MIWLSNFSEVSHMNKFENWEFLTAGNMKHKSHTILNENINNRLLGDSWWVKEYLK